MRVFLWLVEGTWQGCVDAARPLLPADPEVTLLHVAPSEVEEATTGALAGLLRRGRVERLVVEAAEDADLLVWPDETPAVDSIPPPPTHPPPGPGWTPHPT
jgi:hypothetical protein